LNCFLYEELISLLPSFKIEELLKGNRITGALFLLLSLGLDYIEDILGNDVLALSKLLYLV
jgi:hypothetical protein